jgi:hypothetical protein
MCVAIRSRSQRSCEIHHHAAGEFEQRFFERPQRPTSRSFDGSKQEHVAALQQRRGGDAAVALAARSAPTFFC